MDYIFRHHNPVANWCPHTHKLLNRPLDCGGTIQITSGRRLWRSQSPHWHKSTLAQVLLMAQDLFRVHIDYLPDPESRSSTLSLNIARASATCCHEPHGILYDSTRSKSQTVILTRQLFCYW
ncbi:uncharacterized protein YALI1_C31315g [Yarrowia lipolytica]|uniref:Uncharacterized protein n=1 Tax=Yarrowia lipolytica TaxID=4952 RepID=A0A1D8NCB2_YARLL|nr:hypothetical protein YALI1_C31315g [Yarrowia lipolytica]